MEAAPNRSSGCRRLTLIGLVVIGAGFVLFGVLIAAFYIEENARGAAAWKKVRDEVTAQGISLDRKDYIPVVPSADQNFGALPIFAVVPDPDSDWQPSYKVPALDEAISIYSHIPKAGESESETSLAKLPTWWTGRDDLDHVRKRLAALYNSTHPGAKPGAGALEIFGQLCPVLAQLRDENAKRPHCIFLIDFSVQPITHMSEMPGADLFRPLRVLDYEARVALDEKRPDVAFGDLEVVRKLLDGLMHQPGSFGLVFSAMLTTLQMPIIQQGLADHEWSDEQLVQLDRDFGSIDFLKQAHSSMPGSIAVFDLPAMDYYESHRWLSDEDFKIVSNNILSKDKPSVLAKVGFFLTPRGWFDLDHANYVRFRLLDQLAQIDAGNHRVNADRERDLNDSVANLKSWIFWSVKLCVSPIFKIDVVEECTFTQVNIDELRIACRLERYWLRHHSYPPSLDKLDDSPQPHDVITGDPYRYRLRPDGSYLLYSVGWNGEDDGGRGSVDQKQGTINAADWVWPSRYEPVK